MTFRTAALSPRSFTLKRRFAAAAVAVAGLLPATFAAAATPAPAAAPVPSTASAAKGDDALSRMFDWWNAAYKVKGSFTADAFRQHFTDDGQLILNGRVSIHNVQEWAEHFQAIQSKVDEVEIVLPFLAEFQQGNQIYTYHLIRSRDKGKVACEIAAGHGVLRGGKIASLTLVSTELTPEQAKLQPGCWQS